MQKPKESAAETKTERKRRFRFKKQGRIVDLQLFQSIPQFRISGAVRRVQAAVYHRVYFFVAGQRRFTGTIRVCYGVAYPGIRNVFDTRRNVADHACRQFLTWNKLTCAEIADFYDIVLRSRRHHADGIARFYRAFHNTAKYDNPFVGIINRIKNQRLKRRRQIA